MDKASIRDGLESANTYAAPAVKPPPLSVLRTMSKDDRGRLKAILRDRNEFIDHPMFKKPSAGKELFGELLSKGRSTDPWRNSACSAKQRTDCSTVPTSTLTGAAEVRLFLRINYARFRMSRVLSQHTQKRLSLRAVEELLWWHARSEEARCEIVQANMPLVLAMAKRTRLGNIDYAELISEGNMALLRSVNKFDCGRGFKFSTYACRAILKSFSRVAMKSSRYRGRFPTEFDPTLERSEFLEQVRADHEADCVDELRSILTGNSAELNEVEVRVLRARFALGSGEPMLGHPQTLEEVGHLIGVTKERVRQIQNRALAKLREKLQDDFLAA